VVSEQKVLTWLRHDVLRKNPSMGYENILQHIKAVVHLWRIQRSVGFNKEENPRNGALLAGFLQKMKRGRARQRKDLFLDKGVDSLIDGYQSRDLPRISGYFFNQNTTDGLRNRLDFFLGHAILGRSEDKRNAMLSDLYLYEMEEEGPSECQAIVLNLCKGKTNQERKTQIGAAIRTKTSVSVRLVRSPSTSLGDFMSVMSPFPTWLPGSSGTTSVCSEGKVPLRSPTASSTGQSKPVTKLCKFCLPRKRTQCEAQVQFYIDSSLV